MTAGLLACGTPEVPPVEPAPEPVAALPGEAFFHSLAELYGLSYPGHGVFSSTENDPMLGQPMLMEVAVCEGREIRVPFLVGEDRSRTWVLTLTDAGLLLKHDHRHDDGTPHELTNYGGLASAEGTALSQSFPADAETVGMLPEAATNVWTLSIDPERGIFVYHLERHGAPRFRAEFDMSTPPALR
jgi:hypothetical protein